MELYTQKKTLKDINFFHKTVIIRCDFNVPIQNGKIYDNMRIEMSLKTIKYIIKQKAKVVLLSHLGRPKTKEEFKLLSLNIVAKELSKLLNQNVIFINENQSDNVTKKIKEMHWTEVVLLENTRFQDIDGNKESGNNKELAKYWASLCDVFVNDAFGTAHRVHASNVGIATYAKESCLGFLIEKEMYMISKIMTNPKRPFIAIIGGAKISSKIDIIKNLLKIADMVLIGGGMSYTFFKAENYEIGNSLVENDKIDDAKKIIEFGKNKLKLPLDTAISKKFENSKPEFVEEAHIPKGYIGLDIGFKTIKEYNNFIKDAKTVVWNGPMGVFEFSNYSEGTRAIAKEISTLKDAFTFIGGGDSAAAVKSFGYANKFSYISTGGGASLKLFEGKDLPAISAIQNA